MVNKVVERLLMHYRWILLVLFTFAVLLISWNTDDAYHGFVMARNLASGNGFVYNIGERVNASTCPLFDLILGILSIVTKRILVTSILMCTIFSVLAFYIIIFKFCKEKWQVFFTFFAMIGSSSFMTFTTSGLENSLLFFESALFFLIVLKNDKYNFKQLLVLALICSAILTTRMDAGVIFLPITAYCYLFARNHVNWFKMLMAGLIGLLPFGIWEVFSVIYYGFPFPNTYYIKLNTGFPLNEYIEKGLEYLITTMLFDFILIIMIFLAIYILILTKKKKNMAIAIGMALEIIYLIRVGGDFMVGRHYTNLFFISLLLIMSIWESNKSTCSKNQFYGLSKKRMFAILIFCQITSVLIRPIVALNLYPQHNGTAVADERSFYYPNLGTVPMMYNKLVKDVDISNNVWNTSEVVNSIEKGYKGDMLSWAPGVLTFKYNDKFYMSDMFGLGDPLLSKLSATYTSQWRVGHMTRIVPEGYKETLITEENLITDSSLHKYYDILCEVTKGNIWDRGRIQKIINLNLGKYDYLIQSYEKNLESKVDVTIWPYSNNCTYEGKIKNDYVESVGLDNNAVNGSRYNLARGDYKLTLYYEYNKIENNNDKNASLTVYTDENKKLYTTNIDKDSKNISISNILVSDDGNANFSIWLDKGSNLKVYKMEFHYEGNNK